MPARDFSLAEEAGRETGCYNAVSRRASLGSIRADHAMSRPWMPLYVADYLADTGHLSAAEHGAYLLLIMHYWANGGLPPDDRKLARIARMSDKEWRSARDTVADFFGEGWRHERIESELSAANASYERRALAGRKGGNAKERSKQCGSNATPMPDALLKQSQPQPDISDFQSEKRERARALAVEFENQFWPTWPNKVGKPAAAKSFLVARLAGVDLGAIIAGVERYIRDKPPDRPWLNPATFLNQRRFEDSPAAVTARASPARRPTIHDRLARFSDDRDHAEPPHDGQTIDGTLAAGADEPGGRYEAAGVAEPPGADPGRSMAFAGYLAGYG